MILYDYLKKLLPRLDKNKITEDIRITLAELDNICIPSYTNAADQMKVQKLKSKTNADLSTVFYRNFDFNGIPKQSNIISDIEVRLEYIRDNTLYIQEQIEAILENDVITEGLTVKKAILIRAASAFSFLSRYSMDLLNYILIQEAINANEELLDDMKATPAMTSHIDANIAKFARLLSDYGVPTKDFSKLVSEVPEIMLNSKNIKSIQGIYKDKELDPFTSGHMSGFVGSPIYSIRLMVAEWQANRYKANKEKKILFERRLMHLRLLKEEKSNPKIESEIIALQSRVDSIEQYIRDVEDSLDED